MCHVVKQRVGIQHQIPATGSEICNDKALSMRGAKMLNLRGFGVDRDSCTKGPIMFSTINVVDRSGKTHTLSTFDRPYCVVLCSL